MSVLNEGGFNVCDASLELSIENPSGKKEILSTNNKKIKRSEECFGANVTYEPNYSSLYQTSSRGTYKMKLTAVTKNGKYEIEDFFEAKENSPFDIERISATRINPKKIYTNESFNFIKNFVLNISTSVDKQKYLKHTPRYTR